MLDEYGFEYFDVFVVYSKELDEISHAACENAKEEIFTKEQNYSICWDNVTAAYENVDTWIGDIFKYADDNTILMMVSDHGFSYGILTKEQYVGHWEGQSGVFLMSGPNIKKNRELSDITILDFLPTLLYTQNLPVALDMSGRVILEAFENEFTENNPVEYISTYENSTEHSKRIIETIFKDEEIEKLKSLGYLN